MTSELGPIIRKKRDMRSLSAAEVAKQAEVSPAYLSKLESGVVKKPSPNVLHRLAKVLNVPYIELMSLAGYVVPSDKRGSPGLSTALYSEDLTEAEAEQLMAYLKFIRQEKLVKHI